MAEMSNKTLLMQLDTSIFLQYEIQIPVSYDFQKCIYNVLTITFVCLGLKEMEWTAHVTWLKFCHSYSEILE
jgi:hypothetical protein